MYHVIFQHSYHYYLGTYHIGVPVFVLLSRRKIPPTFEPCVNSFFHLIIFVKVVATHKLYFHVQKKMKIPRCHILARPTAYSQWRV